MHNEDITGVTDAEKDMGFTDEDITGVSDYDVGEADIKQNLDEYYRPRSIRYSLRYWLPSGYNLTLLMQYLTITPQFDVASASDLDESFNPLAHNMMIQYSINKGLNIFGEK